MNQRAPSVTCMLGAIVLRGVKAHLVVLFATLSVASGAHAYSGKTALRGFSGISVDRAGENGAQRSGGIKQNGSIGAISVRGHSLDPWGSIVAPRDEQTGAPQMPGVNRKVFTGHQHDVSTGLVYTKARYYDPSIGTFLSQDTWPGEMGSPYTMQPYAYGLHNPMRYTDPTGHVPWDNGVYNGPYQQGPGPMPGPYAGDQQPYVQNVPDGWYPDSPMQSPPALRYDIEGRAPRRYASADRDRGSVHEDRSGANGFVVRRGRLPSETVESILSRGNEAFARRALSGVESSIAAAKGLAWFARLPPWEQQRLIAIGAGVAANGAERFGNRVYDHQYGLFGVMAEGGFNAVTGFGSGIGLELGNVTHPYDLAGRFEALGRLGGGTLSAGMELTLAALPGFGEARAVGVLDDVAAVRFRRPRGGAGGGAFDPDALLEEAANIAGVTSPYDLIDMPATGTGRTSRFWVSSQGLASLNLRANLGDAEHGLQLLEVGHELVHAQQWKRTLARSRHNLSVALDRFSVPEDSYEYAWDEIVAERLARLRLRKRGLLSPELIKSSQRYERRYRLLLRGYRGN